jgi:hypothetical protein
MGAGRRKGHGWGVLAAGAVALAAACSQASSPAKNPGDDVYPEEASVMLPQPDAADYDDGFFNGIDGPYGQGYGMADVYAILTICPPPDGSAGDAGDAATPADAASVTYADASGSGGAYGSGSSGSCQPIPAACASQPNCTCFLTALGGTLPCTYPHCDDGMSAGFSIYCP